MDPQAIFDASKLIAAGGSTVFLAVQMVKAFGATTPRATVGSALVVGSGLTALYALSNGFLNVAAAFDLVVAAFAISAFGAGINAAATATRTG